jgi:hypothetical protein
MRSTNFHAVEEFRTNRIQSTPTIQALIVPGGVIIAKAKAAGHVNGLVPHLIPGGVTQLQYVDDTMIIVEPTWVGITNLKFLLICFENMSGLKINFDKSEVVVMGVTPAAQQRVANLLNCCLGKFPITYLGLPISDKPLRVAYWGFLSELVGHRVEP